MTRPHLPGCVLDPEHTGECTIVPELVDVGAVKRPSVPLTPVEVSSSDPAPPPHHRTEDRTRLRDQDWRSQFVAGFKWTLAPVVKNWPGLSLLRLLAIYIAVRTDDLAHDWIAASVPVLGEKGTVAIKNAADLGFAFMIFVLGGFFLAVVTGLGEKYIDKMLTIIAAKLGVVLVNAPVPDLLKERPPTNPDKK